MQRQRVILELNLSQSQFKQLISEKRIEDKDDYTDREIAVLKQAVNAKRTPQPGKGFAPTNCNGKASAGQPLSDLNGKTKAPAAETPISDTAARDANQQVVGALRSALAERRGLVEHLAQQRESVTDYVAQQVAEILDPRSIDEEIGLKILARLEGQPYDSPFDRIDLTAELIPIAPPGSVRLSGCVSSPQLASSSGSC